MTNNVNNAMPYILVVSLIVVVFVILAVAGSTIHKPNASTKLEAAALRPTNLGLTSIPSKEIFDFREEPLRHCILRKSEKNLLHNLVAVVISQLDAHNVIYWAGSGTLLGIIRHQDLIPWDDDVDLAVVYDQENMARVNSMLEALQHKGYPCGNTESGIKILHKDTLSFPWVDLMMVELGPNNRYTQCGKLAKTVWSQVNYNHDHIFPTKQMAFGPNQVAVPNQPEKVLDDEFGPSWKTHMSFKGPSIYDLRLYKENGNIPTVEIKQQIKHWRSLLPKEGLLVPLHQIVLPKDTPDN